ncbi:nitrate- and nitrite sensing domain-containing protein [Marinobacterium sp. D7]|uniref:nitrate- and nitrite sensing domain-containing protein n=1 Tax=Marinobacterium ramblicola TaxID=2849041 RepID=UPI001C2CCF39|nr:nitrate- and nitrite sensing domain-containing protein [Marinobacterium ramblicola]MBV1787493.1 nitrate- and nitrite sensing domain-containing protein [Marinobacterium ramblicola]
MNGTIPTTETFFLASKRSEIALLQQLMASCELVTQVSNLIHELQRERGLSNVFLASGGLRFARQRLEQIPSSVDAEQGFKNRLQQLDIESWTRVGSARLFNNIAYALHGLDGLDALREKIGHRSLSATESTQAFNRLITALLSVIFEAADISDDPEITRALVAMFNFMQGKEYAGQERAWAVIGFAAGEFDQSLLQRLSDLVDSQQHSFRTFEEFAQAPPIASWRELESHGETQEFLRLRLLIARVQPGTGLPSEISEVWYDAATRRIDRMQQLERQLADTLLQLSRQRVREANKELKKHHDSLELIASLREPSASPLTMLLDPEQPFTLTEAGSSGAAGSDWVHSLYGLVKQQAEGLKQMHDELAAARQALSDRKTLERAKGLLMQYRGLNEEQAYRLLQQTSMAQNRSLAAVAHKLITDIDQLKGKPGGLQH